MIIASTVPTRNSAPLRWPLRVPDVALAGAERGQRVGPRTVAPVVNALLQDCRVVEISGNHDCLRRRYGPQGVVTRRLRPAVGVQVSVVRLVVPYIYKG